MDFTFTEEQQALADLTAQILGDTCTPEALRAIESSDEPWFAADAWAKLAEAGICGVAVPEADGGLGFGLLELCAALEQVGRHVAPVPLLESSVLGALLLAEHGTDEQRARWLPGVADGSGVVTGALVETGRGIVEAPTSVVAARDGDGWVLSGSKAFVPFLSAAGAVVVSARAGDGTTLFVVPADGLSSEPQRSTTGQDLSLVTFDGVRAADGDIVGEVGAGDEVLAWLAPRLAVAHSAVQAGVCEGALRITAGYVSEREQFGVPIGTFQAVGQRAADAYIDTEAVRLTARQAAWRLAEGLEAAAEVAAAKFWAAEGAQRVVHAAQHLHGGIGVDIDYPIHRYFRWAKVHELAAGSGTDHLLALGGLLAAG